MVSRALRKERTSLAAANKLLLRESRPSSRAADSRRSTAATALRWYRSRRLPTRRARVPARLPHRRGAHGEGPQVGAVLATPGRGTGSRRPRPPWTSSVVFSPSSNLSFPHLPAIAPRLWPPDWGIATPWRFGSAREDRTSGGSKGTVGRSVSWRSVPARWFAPIARLVDHACARNARTLPPVRT